jgi:XRE family transcriptional regulator, regulator of sulfur utilization
MKNGEQDICIRLGIRLRKMRERRGWGQEDLAAHSGIGRPFISRLENGKREPCLRSLETLARSFDMTISQFMRGI